MKLEFPTVIKAAQAAAGATWALADAVLAAAKKSPISDSGAGSATCFDRMAAELEEHVGREYSAQRLRRFEQVAAAFPPSKRKKHTVEICIEAGTPENLAAITRVAATRKRKRPVSTRDVRKIIQDHGKRHGKKSKKERPPLIDEDVDTFFETAEVWGGLAGILTKLTKLEKLLTPTLIGKMSEAAIASCAEDCERGGEKFRSIRAKLRDHGVKGAHLSVVNA